MDNKEKIEKLKPEDFQNIFGVKKDVFDEMLKILNDEYALNHKKGGRPSKLSVLDRLVIMLQYYREYRTLRHIAADYDVSVSRIYDSLKWAEETLIKNKKFHIRSRKELDKNVELETVILDVTECEIERPKKNSENITQERKRNTQ